MSMVFEDEEIQPLRKLPMWDRDLAQRLIGELQPALRPFDVHVALGGGVLNKGESFKDLDLYILPVFKGRPYKWDVIDTILDELVGPVEEEWALSGAGSAKEGKCFREQAARRTSTGRRVDVFIVDPRVEPLKPSRKGHTSACRAYGNYQPPYEDCTCGYEVE